MKEYEGEEIIMVGSASWGFENKITLYEEALKKKGLMRRPEGKMEYQ